MNIRIVKATEHDIPGIVRLGRKFWQLTPYAHVPYCPDSAAATCAQCLTQGLLLVAEVDGEMAGFIGAIAAPMPLQRAVPVAAEQFWWVEEASRGTSAARLLREGIEDAARQIGAKYMAMGAFDALRGEAVARVYERAGYVGSERTFVKEL